jgi:glucose/arabinose dehydrogenase
VGLIVTAAALMGLTAIPSRGVAPIEAEAVLTNLAFPAGFTFAPDGRIYFGELFTGNIKVYDPATEETTLFYHVTRIVSGKEQGFLGLALHPNYPDSPFVYAYASRKVSGVDTNQILRIREESGVGVSKKPIWSGLSAISHNGGRILFGPDGKLYAFVGDRASGANAQDLSNDYGKVLRMTPQGSVPPDNPFADSLIYSYGHRNSFGFAFDPQSGFMWETENGPECNDELNRVREGRNHGWGPNRTCDTPPEPPLNTNQDGPNPVLPQAWYTPTIAPAGAAFCEGCGLGTGYGGRLLFGAYNDGRIRLVTLSADRRRLRSETVAYQHTKPVLSLEVAPDGSILFSDPSGIFKLAPA